MTGQRPPRYLDIDSPSKHFAHLGATIAAGRDGTPMPPPLPKRPWWHFVLDDILEGIGVGLLRLGPFIAGAIAGVGTWWLLTR